MSASSFNRYFHFEELNEPLDTQEGVLSPATRRARARTNLGFDGTSVGGVAVQSYTVATVPAAASNTGKIIYVSNGAAGNATLAISNGTNWLRLDGAGGNIAAT